MENRYNCFDIRYYAVELKLHRILVISNMNKTRGMIVMSQEQLINEVKYKTSLHILNYMLEKGMITLSEYKKIDRMNRESFSPDLAGVYV